MRIIGKMIMILYIPSAILGAWRSVELVWNIDWMLALWIAGVFSWTAIDTLMELFGYKMTWVPSP